jgi:hypothetical protein
MKRVLIVSPHFPPTNAPDMQRVRMSLPYYRAAGWEPVVLTVDAADVDAALEPELVATVPTDTRIVRCRAWSLKRARRFGIGNVGIRAFRALNRAGSELLRNEHFDLVFFSTTQFNTFLLGPWWRARFGVPYVLDVQDPWQTDYYQRKGARRPPGGWKYQFARLHAKLLEGFTFRRTAGVISVSEAYLQTLSLRYRLSQCPAEVILFGASEVDLAQARQGAPSPSAYPRNPGEVHILYTGAAGPVTPHAATVLFEALRRYRDTQPERARRLRFHFFGTSYVPPGKGTPSVIPIAQACGVSDQVDEIPHRLGHLECIRLQASADVLLLAGSSDLAYSPSKVYPYYLSGVPMLALVFRDSVLERLLDQLNCAFMVRFREADPKDDAHAALHRFFDLALDHFRSGGLPTRNQELFNRLYLAEELTRQQCVLFDRAVVYAASQQ